MVPNCCELHVAPRTFVSGKVEEIKRIPHVIAPGTLATASATKAIHKAVECKKSTTFKEWSCVLEIRLSSVDEGRMKGVNIT